MYQTPGSRAGRKRSSGGGSGITQLIGDGTAGPGSGTQTLTIPTLVGDSGSGGTKGLVPAPASGDAAAGKFLKADATWEVPSGGSSNTLLTSDPVSPTDDTWWVVREGTSPTMTVSLKARIAGATYTVASVTV